MIALGVGSRKNADIPAAAARTLCDQRNRPAGLTKLPEECRPFYRADADGEARAAGVTVKLPFLDLTRRSDRETDGYSRALQAARVRAAYQRSYFAPALFNMIPVATDLIDSMAVDAHWRLSYNEMWLARHSVEENATLLIHEVGHLLRDHEARKKAAGITDHRRWNTAGDCEINDDLDAEGFPLPGDPPLPVSTRFVERRHGRGLLQAAVGAAPCRETTVGC